MMESVIRAEHVDQWIRDGRGRELQFYATDEEVQHWLISALPREYEPYQIVGADTVAEGSEYFDELFLCETEKFLQCQITSKGLRHKFWLRSLVLTPDLPLGRGTRIDKLCSYNGLVLLQHGLRIEDHRDPFRQMRQEASRIAITKRVRNLETGVITTHEKYLRVFEQLCKAIRRSLVYASIIRDRDGRERESRLHLWTEDAVTKYIAGFPFWDSPGQLIGKRKEP